MEEEKKEAEKLGWASWHKPTLGIDCPYCEEFNDYFKQWEEHEYPFEWFQSQKREMLEDIVFECPDCKKEFELEGVEY